MCHCVLLGVSLIAVPVTKVVIVNVCVLLLLPMHRSVMPMVFKLDGEVKISAVSE